MLDTRGRTERPGGVKGHGATARSKKTPMRSSGGGGVGASRSMSPMRSSGSKAVAPASRSKTPLRSSGGGGLRSSNGGGAHGGGFFEMLGIGHFDNEEFEHAVRHCIPSEFVLIASQDDCHQAQESYFAMEQFNLPVSKETRRINAGSVATCALLQLMHEDPTRLVADRINRGSKPWNCYEVSKEIRKRVKQSARMDARPTISSSRPLGPPRLKGEPKYAPFYVVPPGFKGKRRALLIGVLRGDQPDLKGPPNDIENIRNFLVRQCDFKPADITILLDRSPIHPHPTKRNILQAFAKIVKESKPGDVNFIQFSGHGGRRKNNLFILPQDYDTKGEIKDEVILRDLIKKMPQRCYTTMLVDCCYSGTVGDLPYVLKHNSRGNQDIEAFFDIDSYDEVREKEANGGQQYQAWKQARAERRIMGRLSDAVAAVGQGIASAGEAVYDAAALTASTTARGVTTAAEAVGQTAYNTAGAVGQTAYNTAGVVGHSAYATAEAVGQTAYNTAGVVGHTAYATAGAVGQTAADAVYTVGKTGFDTGAVAARTVGGAASSTLRGSANAANALGSGAYSIGKTGMDAVGAVGRTGAGALRGSANAANALGTGAANTLRRTATGTADAVYTVGKTGYDTGAVAARTVGGAASSTLQGSANAANALGSGAYTVGKTGMDAVGAVGRTGADALRGSASAANALGTGAANTLRRTATGTADAVYTVGKTSANAANAIGSGAANTFRRTATGTAEAAYTTFRGSANAANAVASGAAATLRTANPLRGSLGSRSASSDEEDASGFEEAARKEAGRRSSREGRANRRSSNDKKTQPASESFVGFSPFSAAANSIAQAATTAATAATAAATSAATAATTAATNAATTAATAANSASTGLKHTAASPVRGMKALAPVRRPIKRSNTFDANHGPRVRTTGVRSNKSPVQRSKTLEDVPTNRNVSKAPMRRVKSLEEKAKEAEEKARRLKKGNRVVLFGLEAAPQHNGKKGTIDKFVVDKDRFLVNMDDGQQMSIRPKNLRQVF